MYESFYGLREHPFNLTPDPDFLFINENFGEALAQVSYAVDRRETFALVIGDVGTGKTTLCWALLSRLHKDVRTALILNPLLDPEDLLRAIIEDFGIRPGMRRAPWRPRIPVETDEQQDFSWLKGLTKKELIDELNKFLLQSTQADLRNVLVIDEAQNLSLEALELLRILSNLETSKRKLLQIIFAGQLELDQKLNLSQLRQLSQRITVRCSLQPLSRQNMAQYIYHRLWKAGAKMQSISFSRRALNVIYEYSGGYPRLVNVICDRTLRAGHKARAWEINARMVRTALEELGMTGKRIARLPFPVPVRRAMAATAAVLIFTAFAFLLRPWNYIAGGVEKQTTESVAASSEPTGLEMPSQVQQPLELAPQLEVVSASMPADSPAFLLQVHSMTTQAKADRAAADLKSKGYPVLQRFITNSNGTGWYVVYLGPFNNIDSAEDAKTNLRRRERLVTIMRTEESPGP